VLALCLVLGLALRSASPAAGHAAVERADPAENALLAAPPAAIDLWLTEPADQGNGSPALQLYAADGRALPLAPAAVDPVDPRHITAKLLSDPGDGSFTVGWSVRSATDGHTLSGTYGFRVGASRPAGAATVQGEQPTWWAVTLRWLAFLGTALAAWGFAFARIILRPSAGSPRPSDQSASASPSEPELPRRLLLITGGGAVALLATLADPLLLTRTAHPGSRPPILTEAIASLPDGWWLRLVALALTLIAALILTLANDRHHPRAVVAWAGLAFALAALAGLSLTSHAAAREDWRPVALAVNLVHQWAVALWVGGLAHLALSWRQLRPAAAVRGQADPPLDPASPDPVRRFSRVALGLVVVGVATGVVNAGLILPSPRALWQNPYGVVLLLKVFALVPVLVLATFHRNALRRVAARVGTLVVAGGGLRAEAALVLLVVLGAAVLATMAPPSAPIGAAATIARLDLAAPLPGPAGNAAGAVHLQLQPAQPGANSVVVRLTDATGEPPPPGQAPAVRVIFTPLDHAASALQVSPQPDPSGGYSIGGIDLPGAGWWRAIVAVARPGPAGAPETGAVFYLALPDPSVTGQGPTIAADATSPEAATLFQSALTKMTALHRVRFSERLSDGSGAVEISLKAVSDGTDGLPPGWLSRSANFERTMVGDRQWTRRPGGTWVESLAVSIPFMTGWADYYIGATDFRLGPIDEVGGEPCQVITFRAPARAGVSAAWFTWWVGQESGQVRREAMVQNRHYMVYEFDDFDGAFPIVAPVAAPATSESVG